MLFRVEKPLGFVFHTCRSAFPPSFLPTCTPPPQPSRVLALHALGPSSGSSKKAKTTYVCGDCGEAYTQQFGKCPACGAWGTLKRLTIAPAGAEEGAARGGLGVARRSLTTTPSASAAAPVRLGGAAASAGVARRFQGSADETTGADSPAPSSTGRGAWVTSGADQPMSLAEIGRRKQGKKLRLTLQGEVGAELNRVLGGGLTPGSLILIGGEPGIGKSTLLLQLSSAAAASPPADVAEALGVATSDVGPVLYVSGEESVLQVHGRAERMGLGSLDGVLMWNSSSAVEVLEGILRVRPRCVIVDSIQTMYLDEVPGTAGSVSQVRECAAAFHHVAKATRVPLLLAGHVTKEGSIAGPRVLEHMVDTTLFLEGDRGSALRVLRGFKNRYGSTDETAMFQMEEKGLEVVKDPAALLLSDRKERGAQSGGCVGILLNGTSPTVLEVQALATPAHPQQQTPLRIFRGVDRLRVQTVLAVLARFGRIRTYGRDLLVSTIGGMRTDDPAYDTAIALAVASTVFDRAVPPDLAALGEIGLGGELVAVRGLERRVIEAARLGFSRVIVPGGSHPERVRVPNVTLLPCRTLKEAIRITFAGAAAGDDDRGEAGDFDAEEEGGDEGELGE